MIFYHTANKGYKSTDLTMVALARGIACYMGYLHSKKLRTTFSEHILITPFIEIAQAYKWDYECEFRLKDDPEHTRGGAFKKIDYTLAYNQQVVGIEAKFPSGRGEIGKAISLDLSSDIKKLKNLFTLDKRIYDFPHKSGYLLIVAKHDVFKKLKFEGVKIKRVITEKLLISEYAYKRNILKPHEAFQTQASVGNISYIVRMVKVY